MLELDAAVLAMDRRQRLQRPGQPVVLVAVVDLKGGVQRLGGGGIETVHQISGGVALILAVQIEAARLRDSVEVLLDPFPLLPGVRGRMLQAALHRLAVDADGFGGLEHGGPDPLGFALA